MVYRDEMMRNLTASLHEMYELNIFGGLVDFWQGEVRILNFLFENRDTEINPSILSDALNVSRARITTALTTLRKKGYITMEMCPDDRRRMLVQMTAAGENYIIDKQNQVNDQFDMLLDSLGDENVSELIRLINMTIALVQERDAKN